MDIVLIIYSYAVINGNPIPIRDVETFDNFEYPLTSELYLVDDAPAAIHGPLPESVVKQTVIVPQPPVKLTLKQKAAAKFTAAKAKMKRGAKKVRVACSFMKPITGVLVDVAVAITAAKH